ncbi:hypothetical protein [Mycoplasmopsis columbina]|uniref:hypothetical protein n=1 Tax=Mycoplasmopsis columbina TaxID=114881 RepID=UPI0004A7638B|nr:hypothetical protein [Mycoplasmopsis columbina]VEU76979.1 Uncharacterised protein [Mycoplasmopsis columbina]
MLFLSIFIDSFGLSWFYIGREKIGFVRLIVTSLLIIATITILILISNYSKSLISIEKFEETINLIIKLDFAKTALIIIIGIINAVELLYIIINDAIIDLKGFFPEW